MADLVATGCGVLGHSIAVPPAGVPREYADRDRSHGLFLKLSGILTTKDTKSTKFNKFDNFGHSLRPITGTFVFFESSWWKPAKMAIKERPCGG